MSSKRRQAAMDALDREVRGWQADQELFDSTVIELAGVNKDNLEIQAKDNTIRISGKKEFAYPEKVSLHRRERHSGVFDRTLTVPIQIDAERIKAEYRDGVLALFIPRAESDKPRSIAIS
jgi:HSP20 family protein